MTTVVVTGAGRGIGLALATKLLRRGDDVYATHRDAAACERLRSITGATGKLVPCRLDLREADPSPLTTVLDGVPVDVLVNNAGVMGVEHQPIDSDAMAGWLDLLRVNLLAPFWLTTALVPNLRRSSHPRVVSLSSRMACLSRRSPGYPAYRSSKAALNKVMQLLATDLAGDGIVVCPVNPGWVRTDMGGPTADLSLDESARGLIAWMDGLTMEHSGRFWQWDGTELAW